MLFEGSLSQGSDSRAGKRVDERVISLPAAFIGCDKALPVSLYPRFCDNVQSVDDCAPRVFTSTTAPG